MELYIKNSQLKFWGSRTLQEQSDDPKAILLNNTFEQVTLVGMSVNGQHQGMRRTVINRGTYSITLQTTTTEAPAASRFLIGTTVPAKTSVELIYTGLGWVPLVGMEVPSDGLSLPTPSEEDIAAHDMVSVRKAAIARAVRATIDGELSGEDGLEVVIGGLTGITGTDFANDDDGTEFFAWANTNKASIPADTVVDNSDGTGDITFEEGYDANLLDTTSEDEALTFADTTTGVDVREADYTLDDLGPAIFTGAYSLGNFTDPGNATASAAMGGALGVLIFGYVTFTPNNGTSQLQTFAVETAISSGSYTTVLVAGQATNAGNVGGAVSAPFSFFVPTGRKWKHTSTGTAAIGSISGIVL